MSLIDLLIAPVTDENIVNNIKLQKKSPIPFASKLLPNSKRKKNYQFKYNNKQFNTILQGSKKIITDHSIDVKASAQLGWAVDTGNELEYLNFIRNASIYKLRKMKPSQYMGVRIGPMNANKKNMRIYNFTERWTARVTEYDEIEKIFRYDKFNKEMMLDPALFRSVFNDKHNYPPILPSMLEDGEDTGYEAETPGEMINNLKPDVLRKEVEKEEEKAKMAQTAQNAQTAQTAQNVQIHYYFPYGYPVQGYENIYAQQQQQQEEMGYTDKDKRARNQTIRDILRKHHLEEPKRIREQYIDRIYNGTSGIKKDVCDEIIDELERKGLNFIA